MFLVAQRERTQAELTTLLGISVQQRQHCQLTTEGQAVTGFLAGSIGGFL